MAYCPTIRSPSEERNHTLPSSSTRPRPPSFGSGGVVDFRDGRCLWLDELWEGLAWRRGGGTSAGVWVVSLVGLGHASSPQ